MSKSRASPTEYATERETGTIKTGNDKNKSNIKKWTKLYGPIKKYYTHWNGDRPYRVIITKSSVIIFKKDKNNKYNTPVSKIDKYKNIFIGTNTRKFGE